MKPKRQSEEIVKILLQQPDVDINAKDSNGRTALIWAAKYVLTYHVSRGYSFFINMIILKRGTTCSNSFDTLSFEGLHFRKIYITLWGYTT